MTSMVEDKENVGENLQRSGRSTLVTPIKAIVGERGSIVKEEEPIEKYNGEEDPADEEVKLPVDDFQINGVNATKEVNITALAVVTPPGRSTTKGVAAPFSPELDVCKLKNDMKKFSRSKKLSDRALRPIPHVLNYAQSAPRNDTLTSTWDKKKNGPQIMGGGNKRTAIAIKPDDDARDNSISSGRSDFLRVQSEMKVLSEANKDLERALREAKQKCNRIDEISRINESISQMAHDLRTDRDSKVQQVSSLEERLRNSTETVRMLQTQLQSLEVLNSNLCAEMATNQEMLESKSARLTEAEDQLMMSHNNSPMKSELSAYSTKLQKKDVEIAALTAEVTTLKEKVRASISRAAQQEEENGVLEVKYAEVKTQLYDHESGHGEEKGEWESRLQAKQEALNHAERECIHLTRQLAEKEEELMTLLHSSVQSQDLASSKLHHVSEKLIAAQAEAETARGRVTALEDKDSRRTNEMKVLREALTAEIKALTAEKSELRASCNNYRISLDQSKDRLGFLENALRQGNFSSVPGAAAASRSSSAGAGGGGTTFGTPISPTDSTTTTTTSSSSLLFTTPPETEAGTVDKARIALLEEDLKHARDLLIEFSRSKDDKIMQMVELLRAVGVEVDEENNIHHFGAIGAHSNPQNKVGSAHDNTEEGKGTPNNNNNDNNGNNGNNGLVSRFLRSEERCRELLLELTSSQERQEKAERTIRYLTDEFERSKQMLERQLSSSASSNGDLASKMCDMNEKVEHLMAYGLKLTEQLRTSKEGESRLMETVAVMERQILALQQDKEGLVRELGEATRQVDILNTTDPIPPPASPSLDLEGEEGGEGDGSDSKGSSSGVTYDLQSMHALLAQKDTQLESMTARYTDLSAQLEGAAATLEKAKQSKIKRYNKYVGLQNEYKAMVAQVQRLLEENSDLKTRHKTFVRTVEQTLVGGESRIALAASLVGAGAGAGAATSPAASAGGGAPIIADAAARVAGELNIVAWDGAGAGAGAVGGTPSSIQTDSTAASYISMGQRKQQQQQQQEGQVLTVAAAAAAAVAPFALHYQSNPGLMRAPNTGDSSLVSVVTPSSAFSSATATNTTTNTSTMMKENAGYNSYGGMGGTTPAGTGTTKGEGLTAYFPDLADEGDGEAL